MISGKPRVTVLMPVYNGERYLRDSIDSILAQTYKDYELLIIDDASTDTSRKIILSYHDSRIRFVKNTENLGLIKTLNSGLSLAKGDYIARQDQDDISRPTRLEKQVSYLNAHPEIVLLGTRIETINQDGRKIESYGYSTVSSETAIHWQLMFTNPFAHPSVIMRASIVRDVGGYDERFTDCEDYELFSRLAQAYKTTNLDEVLLAYRCHSSSMNATRSKKNTLLSGDIMRGNINRYIMVDPDEGLIPLWLYIYNPGIFEIAVNARKLLGSIYSAYKQYVYIRPRAVKNQEVRKCISHMVLRISFNLATTNRCASVYCYFSVLRRDIFLAGKFLPRYIIDLILGPHKVFVSRKIKND